MSARAMLAGTAVTNLSQYAESSGVSTGTGRIHGSRWPTMRQMARIIAS